MEKLTTKQLETIQSVLWDRLDSLDALINDEGYEVKKWRAVLKHTTNENERDEIQGYINAHNQRKRDYKKEYKKLYAVNEKLYGFYY